jgi:hypothetical protein
MSDRPAASLVTLPMEILYKIFDDLDAIAIVGSVRNVCQRLRAATDTYDRYMLDFTWVSNRDFHWLLRAVRPENVRALSLSDREATLIQVPVFRSVVNIDLFTQLRSLTLLNIDGPCLWVFLQHAKKCSLTSLILHSKFHSPRQKQRIFDCLSSIIEQATLVHLELMTSDLSTFVNQVEWPNQCKLRSLRLGWHAQRPSLSTIVHHLPELETLVLDVDRKRIFLNTEVSESVFSEVYPRLKSLTISHTSDLLNCVRSLLSCTPSLTYLKITGTRKSMIDGFLWEDLITCKLPLLNKFEFHQISSRSRFAGETVETALSRVIAPFCTPFWTEEKRWLVICTWHGKEDSMEIYTPLVSTPDYLSAWQPTTLTVTNFDTQGEYYTNHEDVLRLQLLFCERHHAENTVSTKDEKHIKSVDPIRIFFPFRIKRSAPVTCFRT